MEKFFIVTEAAEIHKDYFAWKENNARVRDFVRSFFEEFGIKSQQYVALTDSISIKAEEPDLTTHAKVLVQSPHYHDFRKFRANSKIGKEWLRRLKESSLPIHSKPRPSMYAKLWQGRFRERIFDHNGKLYCQLIADFSITSPEGWEEIKGSEFMAAVEDATRET
ncbi:hypothetical protein [Gorillibacterium sp. sgz500922]|uniref:hypothetical protein n=1 Tax=Gorillibacterium sp. sgz500922 TaxID=3446694 RepID=UPI003F663A52